MVKALFRKQMLEVFDVMFRHGRNQRQRTYIGTVISVVALVFVLYILGRLLYNIADVTCELFVPTEYGWCYFAVVGILATVLGVLSSVFTVHSTVYQAKDNELLLSMPIPSGMILGMRLFSSYVICFVFEAVSILPFYLVYWKNIHPGALPILLDLLTLIVFPLLALVISCALGWVLALLNAKLPKRIRNIINFIISFVFVVYFLNICIQASSYMQILQNGAAKGNPGMLIVTYPFACMGKAALGSVGSFGILVLILVVLSAVVYLLLGKSFRSLSGAKNQGRSRAYQEKPLRASSLNAALLKKEFRRYLSNSSYFMNSSIGSILLLLSFVLMLWNYDKLQNGIAQLQMFDDTIPFVIGIIVICIMIGINTISASSISVEGKNLWLMRSLPVSEGAFINSKILLHLIITVIPQLMCSVVLAVLVRRVSVQSILVLVVPLLFAVFTSELGMMLNIMFPKLDWVSESNAVRRNTSTRLAVLISWASVLVASVIYRRLPESTDIIAYLYILSGVLLVLIFSIYIWIHRKGESMISVL